MERKTKHRILGVSVVIGLVIILLPLFQDSKEIPTTIKVASAPPFPNQAVSPQMAEEDHEVVLPKNPMPLLAENTDNTVNQRPDDTIPAAPHVAQPETVEVNTNHAQVTAPPILPEPEIKAKKQGVEKPKLTRPTVKKEKKEIKETAKETKKITQNLDSLMVPHSVATARLNDKNEKSEDGLINLKGTTWVIQMGSFKDKQSALRVVNQLRSKGYKAFIQQMNTAFGDHTRVFVGPENKQTSADALAAKLQREMHLEGIVVRYQPLAML